MMLQKVTWQYTVLTIYNDTTTPTIQMETFRTVTYTSATNGWEIHQVDIISVSPKLLG